MRRFQGPFVEFDLIAAMKQRQKSSPWVPLGIGDDAALLRCPADHDVAITTDLLLDGVHFLTAEHSLEQIARKSLAANVSDIAAMAAEPVAAFLSLGLPRSWSAEQAGRLFDQLAAAAEEFHVVIAGGDTTSWVGPLSINVALYGFLPTAKAICRDGAKIDDIVCVSGPLGGSILGRQFTFTPRVREARWLAENCRPHAMMDISDGLSLDLHRLCRASEVGAEIIAEQVPVSSDVETTLSANERLSRAFGDGEDFELLFAVAPDSEAALRNAPFDLYQIGTVTAETELILSQNGAPQQLPVSGWQSF